MRLVIAGILALASVPVAAQVAPSPLAASEVLLEVEAEGIVRTRADRVTVRVPLSATAATAAEARADVDRQAARLRDVATRAGVAPGDIRVTPAAGPFGFLGNAAMPSLLVQDEEAEEGSLEQALEQLPANRPTEARSLELTLRDPVAYERVRAALEGADAGQVGPPIYTLADPAPALRAARTAALREARTRADAYAADMRLRVARVVRVSERRPPAGFDLAQSFEFIRRISGETGAAGPDVETRVTLSVDYALSR